MRKMIILLAIVAALAIALVILSLPTPEQKIIPDPKNNEIYSEIAKIGIRDAVIDVTDECVFIRYNLHTNMSKDVANSNILRAATISGAETIVIQIYRNFTPLEEIRVKTRDVMAFVNGSISYDELKEMMKISKLGGS